MFYKFFEYSLFLQSCYIEKISKTVNVFFKEVKKNPLTFLFSKCILTVSSQIVQLVQMIQFLGKGGDDMIEINPTSSQPIFEQIIAQIKMAVLKGLLKPGDSIPSVRKSGAVLQPEYLRRSPSTALRDGMVLFLAITICSLHSLSVLLLRSRSQLSAR